jgi:hypothetical protein
LAALLAALVLLLPAASTAGNHQVFTDVVGDDSGGLAPDITSVDVTSDDGGNIIFRISINEQGGTFFVGDVVGVVIDSDQNPNTGWDGAETILWLSTTSSGTLEFEYCNYRSQTDRDCTTYTGNDASDTKTGTNSHVLTFSNSTFNWFTISFYVFGSYEDASRNLYTDVAPESGWYQYDLRADLDNDGVAGAADRCPQYRGGRLDKDGDGCAPLLPAPAYRWAGGKRSGSYVTFRRISVTNAPSAVTVTARFSGFTARRRGSGQLPGIAGRRFRVNSRATITYSNPNYFGRYWTVRITRGGGLSQVAQGCTPPGSTTLIPCPNL